MDEKHPPPSSLERGETKSNEDDRPTIKYETNNSSSQIIISQDNENNIEIDERRKQQDVCQDVTETRMDGSSEENTNANLVHEELIPSSDEEPFKQPVPEQDVLPVDESVIEKLTVGFLQTFLPQSEHCNAELDELMRNQRVLIETLQQENAKFKENNMMSELSELMTEAKRYHNKLVHLKKEMISLHEKSTKLKKRALKLQHHKMKQSLQREQQRERELEQEKHLIAKPAQKTP